MKERIARDITEGKLRAAQMRAITSPDVLARVDALVADIPDLVTNRFFCGPDNGKGRQAMFILPKGN